MLKTSTLEFDTLNIAKEETELKQLLHNDNQNTDEPSVFCINNILNFSKNLEVRSSVNLGFIELIRS
jgi:hypothetical protein